MNEPQNRRARFHRLLRLRQQKLSQVEQQLSQLLQQRLLEQAEMHRMNQELAQVMAAPVAACRTDPTSALESRSRYVQHLRFSIQAQQSTLDTVQARWQQVREKYTQLKAKAESMELLLQEHAEVLRAANLKKEQQRLDDMTLSKRQADHV